MKKVSLRNVQVARGVAVVADFIQIVALPAFFEGVFSPINNVLDVAVAAFMTWRLGWHWAFLPAFVSELVPIWDLVPTWTAAVLIATRNRASRDPLNDSAQRGAAPEGFRADKKSESVESLR